MSELKETAFSTTDCNGTDCAGCPHLTEDSCEGTAETCMQVAEWFERTERCCDNADIPIERMEQVCTTSNHGGKRQGAGRKVALQAHEKGVVVSIRLPVWLVDALPTNRSAFIRAAIIEKLERDCE